jgi:hypothetical protein
MVVCRIAKRFQPQEREINPPSSSIPEGLLLVDRNVPPQKPRLDGGVKVDNMNDHTLPGCPGV